MKIKHIETGEVFEVVRFSSEYWIDDTGCIESDQLGVSWELVDDYKQLYEQQKQRADDLEERWGKLVSIQKKKYEYYNAKSGDELPQDESDKLITYREDSKSLIKTMQQLEVEGDENGED